MFSGTNVKIKPIFQSDTGANNVDKVFFEGCFVLKIPEITSCGDPIADSSGIEMARDVCFGG